jgi:hypothetical protein
VSLQSFQPKLILGSVGNSQPQVLGSMSMDTHKFSHKYTHIDPWVTRTHGMPYVVLYRSDSKGEEEQVGGGHKWVEAATPTVPVKLCLQPALKPTLYASPLARC